MVHRANERGEITLREDETGAVHRVIGAGSRHDIDIGGEREELGV